MNEYVDLGFPNTLGKQHRCMYCGTNNIPTMYVVCENCVYEGKGLSLLLRPNIPTKKQKPLLKIKKIKRYKSCGLACEYAKNYKIYCNCVCKGENHGTRNQQNCEHNFSETTGVVFNDGGYRVRCEKCKKTKNIEVVSRIKL